MPHGLPLSKLGKAVVERVDYRLDISTLEKDASATQLGLNDIGAARLELQRPLAVR